MVWTTVSFRSCFCWLYTASPSSATKNVINLISVLTIWWCSCVKSSLVLLKKGICCDQCISWQNSVSHCPASLSSPKPSLPVTTSISWFPTFAFQSLMMNRSSFFLLLVPGGLLGLHRTDQLQLGLAWIIGLEQGLDYSDVEWLVLEKNWDHSVIFEVAPKYYISDSFVD